MQTKHELSEIRYALQKAISEALNEVYFTAEIEIHEINVNENYSVKGAFKFVPFLSQTIKREGKFETKLDENLKIVTLKITED
ncbi:hypothetical protein MUP38_06130 [Candidatus Bathyarchaeota archaeon]|nr:hypothetical protein [Candidatus Bathyarchaeota archaeon]